MYYYGWIGGYLHASRAATSATQAEGSARRAEFALARLEDQLERQALIIRSLLEVCARKKVFDEPEFRELVNEIDLSDGRLDGKYKPQAAPIECVECGKINGKRAVTCMYCGEDLPGRDLM
jgi:hypothetical protein